MQEVTSYTELMAGIQARLGELGIRQVDFDKLAGFPEGLAGKVFGPSQVKRLGPEKLFDAIRAAGLRLRLEPDPEQLEKMQKQIAENCLPRQENQARNGNHASTIGSAILSRAFGHILRKARKQRWAGKSKAERSESSRQLANARWSKHRKRQKAARKSARTRKHRLALIPKDDGAA